MRPIQMVDLQQQLQPIRPQIEAAFAKIMDTAAFINGPEVKAFQAELEAWTGSKHVIPCANGTDALLIAMMAADLQPGDEVLMPDFTYIATVETAVLLGIRPVLVDIDPRTYNLDVAQLEARITPKTKAVVPVHLFGQCADMAPLLAFARQHDLWVLEDAAQAIGSVYSAPDGSVQGQAGTLGKIGGTSFYPSKNLGAYGDAGALFAQDDALAAKLRAVANHGQHRRYYFDYVGVNSRLDSFQAAVLRAKLPHLHSYTQRRQQAAAAYDTALAELAQQGHITLPYRAPYSTHVFHQYTLRVHAGQRDALQAHLASKDIPSVVFYPLPVSQQGPYQHLADPAHPTPQAALACQEVLSLPMHTELDEEQLAYIATAIHGFFRGQA